MKHCGACKLVKSKDQFRDHDHFCDQCVSEAMARQPIHLHHLDRIHLAQEDLEQQQRMVLPTKRIEVRPQATRQDPWRGRRDRHYGFPPVEERRLQR